MSRSGEITLQFGDEERLFRLGIGQWRKVQEKCDAGPGELLARLHPVFSAHQQGLGLDQMLTLGVIGRWRVDDVREPIYQGLIGGGLDPHTAGRLVGELVDQRPLIEPLTIAYQVVLASFVGPDDEDATGETPAAEGAPTSPAESCGSGTADSTAPAAP